MKRSENSKTQESFKWLCRNHSYTIEPSHQPLIMGVLNITPDSFADGGQFFKTSDAIKHAHEMAENGADIIDIGGESTRPGSRPVPLEEEIRRVIPVIDAVKEKTNCVVSIDTRKSEVARQALAAGANIVNDVSALTADPSMIEVIKASGAGVIIMHMQENPQIMQENPKYKNVVREVCDYLLERINALTQHGVSRESIAVDPGIGFGKTIEHNIRLIAHLNYFKKCGRPLIIGLSRKRFLGSLTGRKVNDRLAGSLGALAFAILEGANILRVHDVKESNDVRKVISALRKENLKHAINK